VRRPAGDQADAASKRAGQINDGDDRGAAAIQSRLRAVTAAWLDSGTMSRKGAAAARSGELGWTRGLIVIKRRGHRRDERQRGRARKRRWAGARRRRLDGRDPTPITVVCHAAIRHKR